MLSPCSTGVSDARTVRAGFEGETAVGTSFLITKPVDPEAALGSPNLLCCR